MQTTRSPFFFHIVTQQSFKLSFLMPHETTAFFKEDLETYVLKNHNAVIFYSDYYIIIPFA